MGDPVAHLLDTWLTAPSAPHARTRRDALGAHRTSCTAPHLLPRPWCRLATRCDAGRAAVRGALDLGALMAAAHRGGGVAEDVDEIGVRGDLRLQ